MPTDPILLFAGTIALLYFLPFFVARLNKKRNAVAIGVLNFLAGWTVVGWIAALVWAVCKDAPLPAGAIAPEPRPLGTNALGVVALGAVVVFLAALAAGRSLRAGSTTPQDSADSILARALADAEKAPRKWSTQRGKDAMDDSPSYTAILDANPLPGNTREPSLVVRCQRRKTELYITTGRVASEYQRYSDFDRHTVSLRLDQQPVLRQAWSDSTDGDALFAPGAVALARQLAETQKLRFEYTPAGGSPRLAEFNVAGFAPYLAELANTCGWTYSPPGTPEHAAEQQRLRNAAAAEEAEQLRAFREAHKDSPPLCVVVTASRTASLTYLYDGNSAEFSQAVFEDAPLELHGRSITIRTRHGHTSALSFEFNGKRFVPRWKQASDLDSEILFTLEMLKNPSLAATAK